MEGTGISVATPAALCRMKRDTVRAKDRQDADALRERFDLGDAVSAERRVQKFRSIEEMNAAGHVLSGEGDFDRFLRHCARYWRMTPRVYPQGVFRFRSIEEAEASRSRHQVVSKAET